MLVQQSRQCGCRDCSIVESSPTTSTPWVLAQVRENCHIDDQQEIYPWLRLSYFAIPSSFKVEPRQIKKGTRINQPADSQPQWVQLSCYSCYPPSYQHLIVPRALSDINTVWMFVLSNYKFTKKSLNTRLELSKQLLLQNNAILTNGHVYLIARFNTDKCDLIPWNLSRAYFGLWHYKLCTLVCFVIYLVSEWI